MPESTAPVSPVVTLRELRDADLPVLFEHQRDAEAVRMAAFEARDRPAFDAHWARIRADPSTVLRSVVVDGAVAGNIGSWPDGERRLVGYWLGREHWGRGVATAALAQFLAVETNRPLHAHVAVDNVGSRRVLEKNGFRPTGQPRRGEDGVVELEVVLV